MIAKVEISVDALREICEKACKVYKQELVEVEHMFEAHYLVNSLADLMRLWLSTEDFDMDDKLILTLEKLEEQK